MMNDGPFRSQMPPQQQQQQMPPQQFQQQQQVQSQQPPQSFQQQQLLANLPSQQQQPMTMQVQQPYGHQGMQQQQPQQPQQQQQPQTHVGGGGPPPGPTGPQSQVTPSGGGAPIGAGSLASGGGGQAAAQDNTNFHPVLRAKTLVGDLKQAIQALMKTAADATKDQALADSSTSSTDTSITAPADAEELRRSLDVFDAVCDQIESNFMMLQDLHREQIAGDRYTPAVVLPSGQKSDDAPPSDARGGGPTMTYKEYEELTRIQAQFASSIRDSFSECSRHLE